MQLEELVEPFDETLDGILGAFYDRVQELLNVLDGDRCMSLVLSS